MSLVKWVDPRAMMNTFVEGGLLPSGNDAVPVIPLSALREVVEGLVQINTEMHCIKRNNQGGFVGDKKACERTAAIAQRLLAQLAEIPAQDAGEKEAMMERCCGACHG